MKEIICYNCAMQEHVKGYHLIVQIFHVSALRESTGFSGLRQL